VTRPPNDKLTRSRHAKKIEKSQGTILVEILHKNDYTNGDGVFHRSTQCRNPNFKPFARYNDGEGTPRGMVHVRPYYDQPEFPLMSDTALRG
jgi:hypothetical protein